MQRGWSSVLQAQVGFSGMSVPLCSTELPGDSGYMGIGVINPDSNYLVKIDWPKGVVLVQFQVKVVHENLSENMKNYWLLPPLSSWESAV